MNFIFNFKIIIRLKTDKTIFLHNFLFANRQIPGLYIAFMNSLSKDEFIEETQLSEIKQ